MLNKKQTKKLIFLNGDIETESLQTGVCHIIIHTKVGVAFEMRPHPPPMPYVVMSLKADRAGVYIYTQEGLVQAPCFLNCSEEQGTIHNAW